MKHVIVGTDGSRGADKAVALAGELGAKTGADVLIVHVMAFGHLTGRERDLAVAEHSSEILARFPGFVSPAVPSTLSLPEVLTREAEITEAVRTVIGEHVLARAELAVRAAGASKVHTVLTHSDDPAASILSVARDNLADAIVVGSRGFGELRALLLGSVSHKIANAAECTVIIAKSPDWEGSIMPS
jgi:nucleotide-binding universal stress UspA family protein